MTNSQICHLFFVMGTTCSGKSTLLQHAVRDLGEDIVGLVEVGKMMRAKYPPEHFEGQASPEHTQDEAWQMCQDRVFELLGYGKRIILVDGQPRDRGQVHLCLDRFNYPEIETHYLLIDADLSVRERRARDTRSGADLEALAIPRLTNDMQTYFVVLKELLMLHQNISVFDTGLAASENPHDSEENNLAPVLRFIRATAGV